MDGGSTKMTTTFTSHWPQENEGMWYIGSDYKTASSASIKIRPKETDRTNSITLLGTGIESKFDYYETWGGLSPEHSYWFTSEGHTRGPRKWSGGEWVDATIETGCTHRHRRLPHGRHRRHPPHRRHSCLRPPHRCLLTRLLATAKTATSQTPPASPRSPRRCAASRRQRPSARTSSWPTWPSVTTSSGATERRA